MSKSKRCCSHSVTEVGIHLSQTKVWTAKKREVRAGFYARTQLHDIADADADAADADADADADAVLLSQKKTYCVTFIFIGASKPLSLQSLPQLLMVRSIDQIENTLFCRQKL